MLRERKEKVKVKGSHQTLMCFITHEYFCCVLVVAFYNCYEKVLKSLLKNEYCFMKDE